MYIIGISILTLLIYKVGIKNIIESINSMNSLYIIPIILVTIISIILGAINIWVLTLTVKKYSLTKLIKHYSTAWAIGMITPGRIGDLSLAYLWKKEINLGKSMSILITDKIISLVVLFLFGGIAIFTFYPGDTAIKIFITALVLTIIGAAILYTKTGRDFIKNIILKKYSKLFKGFHKTNKKYLKNNLKPILANLAISIIRFATGTLLGYLIFISLNIKINFYYLLLIFAVVQIVSLIPITINGLGIREALSIYFLAKLGISAEIVMARSLIELITQYLCAATIMIASGKNNNREEK